MDKDSIYDAIKLHKNRYTDKLQTDQAQKWLQEHWEKIAALFCPAIRDYIFEPFRAVFNPPGEGEEAKARALITQVALINAVLAGLPGSLGVGVYVCIAIELYMAYGLSQVCGLGLSKDEAIKTVIGGIASIGAVLFLFKSALNLVFPVVTAIMPVAGLGTAFTQLIVTNMYGVAFWIMFKELKNDHYFRFPIASIGDLTKESFNLIQHQYNALRESMSLANLKIVGGRLKSWFSGDIDLPKVRGELVAITAMGLLLNNKAVDATAFDGPLGSEFIQSIKDRYPELADSSIPEIASAMAQYEPQQMMGVINLIKGRLFERLVTRYENQDSDQWQAVLHDDPSYPGSDLILENQATGETVEVSLKATDNLAYLEQALVKYPDYPIIATDEVAQIVGDEQWVWLSGLSNEELIKVTQDNFASLRAGMDRVDVALVATASVGATVIAKLWPFVVAWLRRRISYEQLQAVCMTVLPDSGKRLASRLSWAVVLGPVFAWWLLARAVAALVSEGDTTSDHLPMRLLIKPD